MEKTTKKIQPSIKCFRDRLNDLKGELNHFFLSVCKNQDNGSFELNKSTVSLERDDLGECLSLELIEEYEGCNVLYFNFKSICKPKLSHKISVEYLSMSELCAIEFELRRYF